MNDNPELACLQQTLQHARMLFENPDVQVPMLIVFLELGKRPATLMTQLSKEVGVSQAAVSQIVAKLGRGMLTEKGLGLVEACEDPEWRCRKLVRLTLQARMH